MAVLIITPYQQFFDSNGDPLNGGKVYTYDAGTTTPKATYTDNTEATPLSNPVILDSAGRAVIWGTGTYKFIVKDSLDNTIKTVDNVAMYTAGSGSVIPAANAAGTVDAITADFSPNVTLADKTIVFITSAGANTSTAPTLSTDGNTARTIYKFGATALAAGDIGAAGSGHFFQYDLTNTRWELLNPATTFSFNTNIAPYWKDRLMSGGILSNNGSDATNDIDISAGVAINDDGTALMSLSAITKRLDAAWAVGTNQGGLDTGAIANTNYYVWMINRPDTNVTDVLFSTSSTSPTMPTNYTKKKLIGAFTRSGGTIVASRFLQAEDDNYVFTSEEQAATAGTTNTTAHLMTSTPREYWAEVVCKTAQGSLSIGDRYEIRGTAFFNGAGNVTHANVHGNATNVISIVTANGLQYNGTALTAANFKIVHRARLK